MYENKNIKIIELLENKRWQTRYKALRSLITLKDSSALEIIKKMLNEDENAHVREIAVEYLKLNDSFPLKPINAENVKLYPFPIKNSHTMLGMIHITSDPNLSENEAKEDIQPDDPLFSRYRAGGDHLSTMAIQHSYRDLNRYLNWKTDEDGFYKATSHMMRKFFNTQLINAGMPWEIREHMMGHKLKDRVREAYFLADPEELKKVYLRYIEHLSVKDSTAGKYSQDEIRELQRQNNKLCDTVSEMKKELKELKGEI